MILTTIAAIAMASSTTPGLSFEQLKELDATLPRACQLAKDINVKYAEAVIAYSGAVTLEERFFVLVTCKAYIQGRLDVLEGK